MILELGHRQRINTDFNVTLTEVRLSLNNLKAARTKEQEYRIPVYTKQEDYSIWPMGNCFL